MSRCSGKPTILSTSAAWMLFSVLATLAACGGDSGTGPVVPPKPLSVVSGGGQSDTVNAKLVQALTVEIHPNGGAARAKIVVRFDALPTTNTARKNETAIRVGTLTSPVFGSFAVDSTDAQGRARIVVQLGTIAGTSEVLVSVPELGLVDTVRYTVQAGNAAKFTVSVRDTIVQLGGSYTIAAAVADAFGNARTDQVSYTSVDPVLSVSANGVVTATQSGRGRIAMKANAYSDTARASVVPDATVVGVADDNTGVTVMKLDGSGRKRLTGITSTIVMPHFDPSGSKVVFYEYSPDFDSRLFTVDLNGTRVSLPTSLIAVSMPTFAPDGSVYFVGLASSGREIWRSNADGSQATKITTSAGSTNMPDVSPNGQQLAYVLNGTLMVMDLGTRTATSRNVQGAFPRFSPDGTRLLYISPSGALSIMNTDGTNIRTLSARAYDMYSAASWSPDGKWILVKNPLGGAAADLVLASTFEIIPLTTLRMAQMSFKP